MRLWPGRRQAARLLSRAPKGRECSGCSLESATRNLQPHPTSVLVSKLQGHLVHGNKILDLACLVAFVTSVWVSGNLLGV